MTRDHLSLSEARRIALAAQGFDRPRPQGRIDVRHIRRTIQRLGLLQIDYVNVLSPSHYLVLFSRLDELVYRRREFTETWAHEASIVPAATWPLLRACLREDDRRLRALARFMKEHAAYADRVLKELRRRGPLGAEELPEPEGGGRRDSWGWTVPKAALEGHLARGTVAVAGRRALTLSARQATWPTTTGCRCGNRAGILRSDWTLGSCERCGSKGGASRRTFTVSRGRHVASTPRLCCRRSTR